LVSAIQGQLLLLSANASDEFQRISEFMRTYLLLGLYRLTLLLGTSGAIVTALASDSIRARGAVVIFLLKIAAIVISSAFAIMDFSAAAHWNRFLKRIKELADQLHYARFPTPSRWSPFTATGAGNYLHVLIVLLWVASLFLRADA
jgi:hypothetical protein